jgi:hypothetical protein
MGTKLVTILGEEHGFRLFKNKTVRRISGTKIEE